MLLWHWLVLGWLVLLTAGIWITVFIRDDEAERRHPGLRARYLRKAPAFGLVACSLVFGTWGLVSQSPPAAEDPTLLWVAIGLGAAGLVAGFWYTVSPWWEDAD